MPDIYKCTNSLNRLGDLFFCFLIALIITVCSSVILAHADWTIGDDFETLQTTAIGRAEPVSRHIGQENIANGRFYPLGHCDLNILVFIPFGKTALAHYIYIWLQFLLLIFLFWKLLSTLDFNVSDEKIAKASTGLKTFALVLFTSSPGFLWVFTGVNFSDRILMILFAFFALMFLHATKSVTEKEKNLYYSAAALTVFYASYIKEPVAACFCIFAASGLLFHKNICRKEKFFYLFLLINGIVFFILYYFLAFKPHTSFYTSGEGGNLLKIFGTALMAEKTLLFIFLLTVFRLYRVIFKEEKCFFTDSLLFSGAGYAAAFIILKLAVPYYFTPAMLLSMPALVLAVLKMRKSFIIPVAVAAGITIVFNISAVYRNALMAYTERTTHMPLMRTIAEHIKSGGILYWHRPHNIPMSRHNPTILGQRYMYNVFIDYAVRGGSSAVVPGSGENFIYVSEPNEIELNEADIFFMPLYREKDGQPIPAPDWLLKKLEQSGFGMLRCDLVHIRIFLKKGSYLEKNWYLANTGTVPKK